MNTWLDRTQPLWLPKGSVRAMMALMLVGSLCTLCLANVVYDIDKDKFNASMHVIEGIACTVAGYYYRKRNDIPTEAPKV